MKRHWIYYALLSLVFAAGGCGDDTAEGDTPGQDTGYFDVEETTDTDGQHDSGSSPDDASEDAESPEDADDPQDTGEPLPPPDFGEPIEVAEEELGQWVWISMPEMRCTDGSEGGFAVNFTDASRDLVIYLQGGGICYDTATCSLGGAPKNVGDDPLRTALDRPVREQRGFFDRENPANPLRDSNFVVVPHCTGDHHTGNRLVDADSTTYHHVGYTNITRMLERVVPSFADANRVVLAGFSAGGVGISANYHQLASAFESVGQPPPYLMIDAGPFVRPPHLKESGQQTLRERWGLDDTIGTFCQDCFTSGYHEIYKANARLHPGMRASLVTTYEDDVIRFLYTALNEGPAAAVLNKMSGAELRAGLQDLADWVESQEEAIAPGKFRFFYYGGTGHGTLHVDGFYTVPGVLDFIEGQLGEGDWASVRP